jgi:DNA-binding LacI/PurR family transcriptional regulator
MKRGKPEKYIALAEDIRILIKERGLKNGAMLPSERNLSQIFECSHLTVRKALRLLEQEKLIHKVPSKGNFVGGHSPIATRSGILGFIFPDDEIFYYKIFSELEKTFSEAGLHPIVHLTHNIQSKEEQIIDFLEKVGADALIAVPNSLCAARYSKLNIPLLFFDLYLKNLDVPYVITDDYQGACRAVEYLISLGHKKIAHISGTYDRTSQLRLQGYRDMLESNNIGIDENYIKCKEPTREWGYYAARELFTQSKPPTAIFCGNDTTAAGVFRYMAENGIKAPTDCSMLGFGNTAIAEDLGLSSVSQHSAKIVQAIRGNLQIILKGDKPPRETMISTSLIIRSSTAKPQNA